MTKTKRVTSVLLTLCLAVVMLAGILIAAPVKVQAADYYDGATISGDLSDVDNTIATGTVTMNADTTLLNQGGTFWIEADAMLVINSGVTFKIHSDYFDNLGTVVNHGTIWGDLNGLSNSGTIINYGTITPAVAGQEVKNFGTIYSDAAVPVSGNPVLPLSALTPTPAPAPDAGTGEYYDRHYNFWNGVHAQLSALPNNGRVTVDTEGHNLDMVMHFTFDALNNTNRTLIIKHQGSTYTIRGKAESADHVWMGGILLGNNHSFSILGAYRK